jgi:alkylation response protein AidB-like acyl-CoA dehydrogenase
MALTDAERDELRSTARSMLARVDARATVAQEPGFDRELWRQMVELGWTSIHVPERLGGAGCGFSDVAVVLVEMGRALTPSPFLASALMATSALVLAGNGGTTPEQLEALVSGDAMGAVALASTDGAYDLTRATTTWRPSGRSVRIAGASGFVLDADVADVLVVAARDGDGVVAAFAVDRRASGVRIERMATVDQTRRLFTVAFDDVEVPADRLICEPGSQAEEMLRGVLSIGVIAASCDAVGVAERAMEGATEYAKTRSQFGKPIGSFQAVKHHCADMAIAVQAALATTQGATDALDGEQADWARTAAASASYVGPACSRACALALLVHGGIGFTWEHASHLYLKRAKLDEMLFGSPSWHRRRLADEVFPALVAS